VRAIRLSIALLLGALTGVGGLALWWQQAYRAPGPHAKEIRLTVMRGESVRSVLADIAVQGGLAHPTLIDLWARHVVRPRVQVGRYVIAPGASAQQILQQLSEGRVLIESLTIIEGSRFRDFRRALEAHSAVEVTLRGLTDAEVMARLGRPDTHPEGRFFPDTYLFAYGTPDLELLQLAEQRMRRELEAAWRDRAAGLPLAEPAELLTLASIVERESALASERPRVAGIYVQRLREGMRLQSDPTVIYGLGENWDGNIRTRDLRTDTPYNTYTRKGLPPTPIALPGLQALRASSRPDITGELFFVATGLPNGSHVFSRTYPEHRKAVQAMLARQRAGVGQRAGAGAGNGAPEGRP
jgi:UPF0755 protein